MPDIALLRVYPLVGARTSVTFFDSRVGIHFPREAFALFQ